MSFRIPNREEWVRIYMATHSNPRITQEQGERAYDLWIASLRRGEQVRRRLAALGAERRAAQAEAGIALPDDWPAGSARERQRERISNLFRCARNVEAAVRRDRERRDPSRSPFSARPSVGGRRPPPPSAHVYDRGYVPDFAENLADRAQEGSDDGTD